MSLPANVKLMIHRPTEAHAAPKQAMIVRMSAEALDALQASPRMQFTFGQKPGIIIGDTLFPMRPLKENSPHDLYLRAPSASKPLAPLKLYANITGKFTVERDLDTIQNEIRSSTQNAEKSRQERTTVMLDAPPADLSQASRKRKVGPSNARKPAVANARSSIAAHAPSPLPPSPSSSPHRTAVVKALAIKERTFEEILLLLPKEESLAYRKQVLHDLLNQLAEKKDATRWRLKPTSWVEVRPWDWHDLSEQERTVLARTARLTFGNLNIPETDPVWDHVVYRKTAEGSSVPTTSSADVPKRGVSSKEAKEKKMKPKADPKAEVMMRDETKRVASPSGGSNKVQSKAHKGPGSGSRVSKPSDDDTISSRSKPAEARREQPAPVPFVQPAEEPKIAAPRMKKREPDAGIEVKESLKRKKAQDIETIDSSLAPKRRKTDPISASGELSLPRKPAVVRFARPSKSDAPPVPSARSSHTLKSRSEAAILPPTRSSLPARPTQSQSGSQSNKASSAHRSSTSNPKRREPIYTSSEDEGVVSSRKEAPLPAPPSTSTNPSARPRPQPVSRRSPQTDREGLRATYKATYRKYLSSYQRLFAQQSKLESLLGNERSPSDSEGDDVEVLSPEETMKLKADYKRWEKELVHIRSIFEAGESSE